MNVPLHQFRKRRFGPMPRILTNQFLVVCPIHSLDNTRKFHNRTQIVSLII